MALVPSAAPISRAVSGEMPRLPEMIWFTTAGGRPMIAANSSCVHPRSSSSSFRYSPGGKASAGIRSVTPPPVLVVVLNADDRDPPSPFFAVHLDYETPLPVDAEGVLVPPTPLQLLESQTAQRVKVALVVRGTDRKHDFAVAANDFGAVAAGERRICF